MPKLSFLLPCRTFSNDAETGALTIVELLDQVTVNLPSGTNPNGEGVIPAPWAVVNLWIAEPQDHGKAFEQRLTLVTPSGTTLMENNNRFDLTALKHRMTLRVNGFPIAGQGVYRLRIEYRTLPGTGWTDAGEYPIDVRIS
ncbi:MAG: hypothetical protein SFU56_01525 [Capsulimonadales bacterium]|nr:hypothetical protein [Capsulimonadales bacterium]